MSQDTIFKEKEGDNWFKRNKDDLTKSLKKDIILKIIKLYNLTPRNVLELGCANGYRLNYLLRRYGWKCTGVDCSKMAIKDGRHKYKGVRLLCGGIDRIVFKDESFDLIIINFVFHWIDRDILDSVISEVDRVLKDGGLLIFSDFFPLFPMKKEYHHLPEAGIYTYKDDYSNMFIKLGYYQNIGRIVCECGSKRICADAAYDNRLHVDLLKKDFNIAEHRIKML